MSSINTPKFTTGQRVMHNGRPATILQNGKEEGSVVFLYDDCPDHYFTSERNIIPLTNPQSND